MLAPKATARSSAAANDAASLEYLEKQIRSHNLPRKRSNGTLTSDVAAACAPVSEWASNAAAWMSRHRTRPRNHPVPEDVV
ncbi:MAG: hypothetical protein R2682_01625 [Pyrinomonadaceae bacterium]